MVVQEDAGEGIDEDLELGGVGNFGGEAGIQGVDALDDEDAARLQLDLLAVILPQARDEIELRDIHFLAREHLLDVGFHQGMVYRVEVVEVEASVREPRGVQPVHEIVVRGHGQGLEAAGLELDGQALAESGLSGGGRAGDQDYFHGILGPVATVDFLGDLDDLLLLERLGDLDQFAGVAFEDGVVHVAHRVQAHDDVPAQVLLEHLIRLGLVYEGRQYGRIMPVRDPEENAIEQGLDVPDGQVTG